MQTLDTWLDVPTEALQREILRRQDQGELTRPQCGSKSKAQYNTPIHVFALFLILLLSAASCAFPIAVRRFPSLPVPHRFLFLSRHFGTGVLIATAFVHLFPTAYISLTDPCLPSFWNHRYPAMPGFVAMVSVFVVVAIEMFFALRGAGHVHSSEYDGLKRGYKHDRPATQSSAQSARGRTIELRMANEDGETKAGVQEETFLSSTDDLIAGASPPGEGTSTSPAVYTPDPNANRSGEDSMYMSDGQSDLSFDLDEMHDSAEDTHDLLTPNGGTHADSKDKGKLRRSRGLPQDRHRRMESRASVQLSPAEHSRALLQCLLLEAGILFHSIFIGMALSVSTGPPFIVLLVAISFHQTFEGLALGSRISALNFPEGSPQPWLMALAYGTTTPIGQAIGLAVHRLYDPASQTGLLVVGLTNAVSSGLLLFAGLVELLAEDFLSEASYNKLKGRSRLEACGSVVAGSMLMALVGAWA